MRDHDILSKLTFAAVLSSFYYILSLASRAFVRTNAILRCKVLVGNSQTLCALRLGDAGCALMWSAKAFCNQELIDVSALIT